ncbi:MAG: signal recognition particle protein [Acidobacteriia bacterium]|nr:signal recognition particle protein [Terriglobia bacterium]
MFDNLTEKFQRTFKTLRGEAKLTENNIDFAMHEIRVALLEADVNFKVVKEFIDRVRTKCLGAEVMTALSPAQQVIAFVRDELIATLGDKEARIVYSKNPPSVFLIVGLQGSGKTTSTGKLAGWLMKNGHRPLLLSVDVYRPAAREQLAVVARDVNAKLYPGEGVNEPLKLAKAALREASLTGYDVLLVDTAGRLHVDEALMQELSMLKRELNPSEILFVADAMTGQDAVKSAAEFHELLGISGVLLTKLDGDARGGAALSIRAVTGQPIKFVGVGEKLDALEQFYPDRMVSRLLGMGDVLSLIEKAQETFDLKQAERLQEKLRKDEFSLADFRDQIQQMRKMGPLDKILGMLPQIGPMKDLKKANLDERELVRTEAIINSMTERERNHHQIINGQRRKRIARGSGTTVNQVNQVLKQYAQMRKMMKSVSGGLMGGKIPRNLSQFLPKN